MTSLVEQAIREPHVESVRQYGRRVTWLALAYLTLFLGSLLGIILVVWQGQLYVALSQRSNVETLTLAFLLIFFAYLATLSAPGALGGLRMLYHALLPTRDPNGQERERRKMRALGPATSNTSSVALNVLLEREGQSHQAFTLAVADRAGSMGAIVVDGAEVTHRQTTRDGSNTLLAFFIHQVNEVLRTRGAPAGLEIVEWRRINDEATEEYLNLTRFARNLERQLNAPTLWPKRTLTAEDCAELERRLSAVCPALRNEAFLPHWEYEGKHQLPLIPEPLGLISLSRNEKRVDPLASMGCAVAIVLAVVFVLILIIVFPPWVPGS